mmetsp:Transcript_68446/g.211646  ORF Transcript_68446/g.211646 Transcript_68446/m.211646 type:complete len:226 (-) Transcript_68446:1543-2220(-)
MASSHTFLVCASMSLKRGSIPGSTMARLRPMGIALWRNTLCNASRSTGALRYSKERLPTPPMKDARGHTFFNSATASMNSLGLTCDPSGRTLQSKMMSSAGKSSLVRRSLYAFMPMRTLSEYEGNSSGLSTVTTTTAAPYRWHALAMWRNSSSPGTREIAFTMHFPWTLLKPSSITDHFMELRMKGALAALASVAQRRMNLPITCFASVCSESKLKSKMSAPASH